MAIVASSWRGRSGAYEVDSLILVYPTDRQGIVLRHAVNNQVITLGAGRDMGITQSFYDTTYSSYGDLGPAISRAQQMIDDSEIT